MEELDEILDYYALVPKDELDGLKAIIRYLYDAQRHTPDATRDAANWLDQVFMRSVENYE